MSKETMKLALEALEANRRTHYYCEDIWYSCPKHEDGCANESEGDECNCGTDEINAQIDKAITALREALAEQPAQPQEPVAWRVKWPAIGGGYKWMMVDLPLMEKDFVNEPLYTSPPTLSLAQRKPLTDGEIKQLADKHLDVGDGSYGTHYVFGETEFARAIEAAHGIKENT